MQFSRIVAFFLAFMSFGVFAFASAVPVVKRDDSPVLDALATLKATVDPLVVQINAFVEAKTVDEAHVGPVVVNIYAAVDVCVAAVAAVEVAGSLDTPDAVATAVANIIAEITVALDACVEIDVSLGPICGQIDVHIYNLIVAINVIISAFLSIVATVCAPIKVDLEACLWVKVIALLGL